MADWTVASFLRRRVDLDFFNFARERRVSLRERENCASLRFESRKSGRTVHARRFECALGCFVARSKESFVRGVCFRTGWLDVREGFRTIARVYARLCDRMGFFRSHSERARSLFRGDSVLFSLRLSGRKPLDVTRRRRRKVIRGRALDDFSLLALGNAYLPKRLFPLLPINNRETSN